MTAGKISFVRRWIAGLTVLALAIVATMVVVLWRRVYDPRQYPDSDHVTLSSALDWALCMPKMPSGQVKRHARTREKLCQIIAAPDADLTEMGLRPLIGEQWLGAPRRQRWSAANYALSTPRDDEVAPPPQPPPTATDPPALQGSSTGSSLEAITAWIS